jgi:hypothetical protein
MVEERNFGKDKKGMDHVNEEIANLCAKESHRKLGSAERSQVPDSLSQTAP